MVEIKLIHAYDDGEFEEALRNGLTDGWIPHYESFQLTCHDEESHYAILATRGSVKS